MPTSAAPPWTSPAPPRASARAPARGPGSLGLRRLAGLGLVLGLGLWGGTGCGTNNLGSKLAPPDPSATDALGQTITCTNTSTVAEPYVVDLRGADRSHLEAVMSEGIAVVRYDCDGLEVLRGCTVGSAVDPYTFVGVSMKEDQVQIDTIDQLRANLPASAVQLEGEVTSGAAIDIGLVMVGRKSIRDDMVAREDLKGPGCEGATHFVRSAIVGAFAVEKGTQGKARAAAEIFGAGAAAGSEANRRVANRDGKPEDCNNAKPGDSAPPEQCRAAITIELYPIAEERPAVAQGDDEGSGESSPPEVEALEAKCPPGFVRAGGKCTPPQQVASFQCAPMDFEQCTQQCERGNGPSCYNLGVMLRSGGSGRERQPELAQQRFLAACKADDGPAKACTAASFELSRAKQWKPYAEVLQRGCDRGDSAACDTLGYTLLRGRDELTAAPERGVALLERACGMGRSSSCRSLAINLVDLHLDEPRGLRMLELGCERGEANECVDLAMIHRMGRSAAGKRPERALEHDRRACDLGNTSACGRAGKELVEGKAPIKRDLRTGVALLERGCPTPEPGARFISLSSQACTTLAGLYQAGKGGGTAKDAVAVLERGCSDHRRFTCVELSAIHAKGAKGLKKDPAKAEQILRRACDDKDVSSCTALGKQLEAVDQGIARAFYEDACTRTRFPPLCRSSEKLGGKGLPPPS
ncbi:MAG: sel1 repeat family protein [Myxococcales bacterium]|nr:sel1 repeat family protein [Myxococcales bacterium]